LGFTLHVVGAQANGQAVISSSRIRALLAEGDVDKASMLLGRPYRLCGDVIQGAQRGRTIGIPTANIQVPITRATPGTGVYVCEARVGGIVRRAAVNIGKRPTFELADVPISVEAHLLDYAGDLYGQTLELAFLSRLRGEQKFDTVDALIAQIREDVEAARTFSNPHA
jgi:riboflavin kinase/FMN adenylyltransferase